MPSYPRDSGKIITLTGLGRVGENMSKGPQVFVGIALVLGAGIGGYYLWKSTKKGSGTGQLMLPDPTADHGTVLGDHSTAVKREYAARQRELLAQRSRSRAYRF